MATLGLHPRLARALLDATPLVGERAAAEVVVLLDDDTLAEGIEVAAALSRLRSGSAGGAARWRAEVARLRRLLGPRSAERGPRAEATDPGRAAATVVALAYPERLARARPDAPAVYLMAGGTAAELPAGSPLAGEQWLAIAVADRAPGAGHGRIRLAAPADRELAELAAPALLSEDDEVGWVDGDVQARRVRRLGAIVLAEHRLAAPDPDAVAAAVRAGLRAEGTGMLRWTDHARRLRDRLTLLHRTLGDPWPDVSDAALLAAPERWWTGPFTRARNRADLARIDAAGVLRAVLPPHLAARLDELAPERVEVPSGSRITLDYSGDQPVLAVRVQEVFGWTASPTVAGGRTPVLLHLLSPAGRPAAVTADLTSFWATGYPQVRAELRGRYPKHAWPEDPRQAAPTRRVLRRQ
jgi:ATP-dependent helicase HrpB